MHLTCSKRIRRIYPCEQCEVLEASIEMGFLLEAHNLLEMRVIDVRVHPKQTLKYRFDNFSEIRRKRRPCGGHTFLINHLNSLHGNIICQHINKTILFLKVTEFLREQRFIIELSFDPIHQILDILWRRNFYGFLYLNSVSPSVFKPVEISRCQKTLHL